MAQLMNQDRRGEPLEQPGASASGPTRRPYKSPQLTALGSVRELTLGGSGNTKKDKIAALRVKP